jgi:hypothetical protein
MPSCRILHFTRDLLLLSLMVSTLGQAQQRHFLSLEAGPSAYDLSGTGTAPAASLAVGFAVAGPLRVVPALTWFSYDPGSGQKDSYVFPEISLQLGRRVGIFSPYFGIGGGRAYQVGGSQPHFHTWTLHATAGAHIPVSHSWAIGGEFRLRALDPFHGSTADWMAGIVRFF